jgi:hypothetical protein
MQAKTTTAEQDAFLLDWVRAHPAATSWDDRLIHAFAGKFGGRGEYAGERVQRRLTALFRAGKLKRRVQVETFPGGEKTRRYVYNLVSPAAADTA